MKKIFSWGKVLPVLGVGLLVAGALAFATGDSSSAREYGHRDSLKYELSLTEAPEEAPETTEATTPEEEDGDTTKIELNSYRILEDEPEGVSEPATLAADFGNNNLRFQADSGKASPMLFEKANTGEVIPEAELIVKKDKWGNERMKLSMTNLIVTSYQNTASQDEDNKSPQDIVVLSYETLEIANTENKDSVIKEGWNFKENKEM